MKLPTETIEALQRDPGCIRNVCILAHVDHGKTSLSDLLLATNGIVSQRMAGKVRYLDLREDEQLRGITMEASAISLYFKVRRAKAPAGGSPDATDAAHLPSQPVTNGEESEGSFQQKSEGSSEGNSEGNSEGSAPQKSKKSPAVNSEGLLQELPSDVQEHLINLIDSPGHIDFSLEVSTAARLCDGAIIVVDVIEGVCLQTVNVIRQCWVDKLKPLLVLNKVDRLVLEWRMLPAEAYAQLTRVIEQVNLVLGLLYAGDRMADDMRWRESGLAAAYVEASDLDLYFAPERNNVVFASASDGWGFTVGTFARLYAAKLGLLHAELTKGLWGDFTLDKRKQVVAGRGKPLFVALILEQVWAIYDAGVINRDETRLERIIEKVGARVGARDLRGKDHRQLVATVMLQWIPLAHALLGGVVEKLPSPVESQGRRMGGLVEEAGLSLSVERLQEAEAAEAPKAPETVAAAAEAEAEAEGDASEAKAGPASLPPPLSAALLSCLAADPPHTTVAYVSKMMSVPHDMLPREAAGALTAEELAARSRRARELACKASAARESTETTDEYKVVSAFEWEEEAGGEEEEEEEEELPAETLVAVTRVFSGELLRGQRVTVVGPKYDAAAPGQGYEREVEITDLFLIMGRELVRMARVPAGNICGVVGLEGLALKNATLCGAAVAEPLLNLAATRALVHNKPIMQVAVEPTNPARLERLEAGLARLAAADPVLEYYTDDDLGELIMCVAGELHLERCLKDLEERFSRGCEVSVKEPVIPFREGLAEGAAADTEDAADGAADSDEPTLSVYCLPPGLTRFLTANEEVIAECVRRKGDKALLQARLGQCLQQLDAAALKALLAHAGASDVDALVGLIVCFGPKRVGANLLVDATGQLARVFGARGGHADVVSGFQLATNEGPLAAEQLTGVLVVVRAVGAGRITATRDAVHAQFLRAGPRLHLAMYTCDIQALAEVLGKVYAVVQKRGGQIILEEMKEGTPFFTIEARIPVVEAFGFSEDIRKKTLGAASPQLVFDGFDQLDMDPFWVPHTEEELEELGEFAERENVARRYMNAIRRRKGLFVDEKVVKNAEKQRTLKKD